MKKECFKIIDFKDKKVVSSFDYYKATGLSTRNYTRWIVENALIKGRPDVDYFPAPENTVGRTIRFRLRYYFDIDFAIILCLLIKRRESESIRDFLLETKGVKVNPQSERPDLSGSSIHLRNFKK